MVLNKVTTGEQMNNIHRLYLEAFPQVERKPFDEMVKKAQEGKLEFVAIEEDNGEFIGLGISILYDKYALLDYFAIEKAKRGMGYGRKALMSFKERYSDRLFLLEIESTFDECDNLQDRLRRKGFYLSCGMVCMPYIVNFLGTLMEVLTFGESITYEEHKSIYSNSFEGDIAKRISFDRFL